MTLGDGHLAKTPRTEILSITLGTDKPLLWQYTENIVENIFKKKPFVHKRKSSNCVDVKFYQKNLSERLGIPCGSRSSINILLPQWIWGNNKFLTSALKGLFEAEGSFSVHKPTCTYNLSFSNRNTSLLDIVENILCHFGFHPERRKYAVRLRKRDEALKFEKMISFRSYP